MGKNYSILNIRKTRYSELEDLLRVKKNPYVYLVIYWTNKMIIYVYFPLYTRYLILKEHKKA